MEKNPKACEMCRARKIRCDGKTPCEKCKNFPEKCTYRLRTRVRRSNIERAAAAAAREAQGQLQAGGPDSERRHDDDVARPVHPMPRTQSPLPPAPPLSDLGKREPGPQDSTPKSDPAYSHVYQSVTAAHEQGYGKWTENSRLFYGPASQFAFLQQVHRGLISSAGSHGQQDREVQEGGPGLDLFLQRIFFFGTAPRVDISSILRPASTIFPEVPLPQARIFLEKFKAWTARHLPLFTNDELDKMLENLYSSEEPHSRPSQTKALTLAVLAVGALATPHTDTAEVLLTRAKYEATLFSDTVSLQMIQFSLLLADYHLGMGRPNLVYLSVGTACRKAFALGLHRESANSLTRCEDVQKYRKTLWSLYSMENSYSMTVGRESSLKISDISSPFPEGQPLLVGMSRLAEIAERTSHMIYTQRYDSLRKLYMAAEAIHAQLRDFADKHGIGSALENSQQAAVAQNPVSLMLHNLFYHTILLTYRPFLVADAALASTLDGQGSGAMWLRQACRIAIDSAQDGILYAHTQIKKHDCCRTSRYNGFFFESNCAVLFFDILRHPSKYPYNVEYVHMALQSLDSMVDDEPVTNARNSIRQILRVVEETIARKRAAGSATTTPAPFAAHGSSPLVPQTTTGGNSLLHPSAPSFLSQDPQGNLIYFPDLGGDNNSLAMSGLANDPVGEDLDPLSHFHYDVLATDLHSFFSLNMTPPSVAGTDAGVLGGENGHMG